MSEQKDSSLETEKEKLKSENETLKRENAELRETVDKLKQSLDKAPSSKPKPIPAPRGQRPTDSQSQVSSETAASGSNDSELQRQLNDAIQQLSETRKQLLNVEDQLTVVKQVTAATQRRELVQEGAYENLPTTGVYEELRFDPTQEHVHAKLQTRTHIGCTFVFTGHLNSY